MLAPSPTMYSSAATGRRVTGEWNLADSIGDIFIVIEERVSMKLEQSH